MSRRSRRWYWAGVIGALALTASGAGAAVAGVTEAGRVESAVETYFDALADGRAADALALGDLPDGDRSYLTAAVLRVQNEVGRIADLRIGRVSRGGGQATVDITYRLGGTGDSPDLHDTVALHKKGLRWRLSATAARVSMTAPDAASRIALAGTALPDAPVLVFPGALPAQTNTQLLGVDRDLAIARFTASEPVTLRAVISETGRSKVAAALDAALAACLQEANDDPSCPTAVDGVRFVPGSMSGTLTEPPSAAGALYGVTPDPSGRIVVSGTFRAQATWQELDFNNIAQDHSAEVTLRYTATVPADEPVQILWGTPS